MAAVAPPPEEVAMAVFGTKPTPKDPVSDGDATLLWGQDCKASSCDDSGRDSRPNPEGSHEEAVVVPSGDEEAFSKASLEKEEEEGEEEEEEEANAMPEAAAHVFVPIDPYCIERTTTGHEKTGRDFEEQRAPREGGRVDPERQNFVSHGYSAHFDDLPGDIREPKACADRWPCFRNGTCSSANLKAVASMLAATVIFPCLLYGAYVFLPFDVPLMPTMGTRLVYALRCGVFATFPIVVECRSGTRPFPSCRHDCLRGFPPLLLLPPALWGAAQGGGDPPALRLPVGPPLHPLLLQHRRPLHLPAPGRTQTHPALDRPFCHRTAPLLVGLRHGALLPRLRLRLDVPPAAHHAPLQPLQHVPQRFGEHVCHKRCHGRAGQGCQASILGLKRAGTGILELEGTPRDIQSDLLSSAVQEDSIQALPTDGHPGFSLVF
nr:transmembrane protein 79 isoform X1 [Anolis sagrei ordinatus]